MGYTQQNIIDILSLDNTYHTLKRISLKPGITLICIQLGIRYYPLRHHCLKLNQRMAHQICLDGLLNTINNYTGLQHSYLRYTTYAMAILLIANFKTRHIVVKLLYSGKVW